MNDEAEPTLSATIEAVLLIADEPVADVTLAQVLERPRDEIAAALAALAEDYSASGRGFELREVAGGWRFYTRPECAPVVERFVLDGQQARLTQAALETLAVVAYRQPVSRARVSAVRGVNCDGVMRTLTTRGLIEESGIDIDSGATLFRTTSYFLERLGMTSLDDLPPIGPYLPDATELADLPTDPMSRPGPRGGSGTGEPAAAPGESGGAGPDADAEPETVTTAGAQAESNAETGPEDSDAGTESDIGSAFGQLPAAGWGGPPDDDPPNGRASGSGVNGHA